MQDAERKKRVQQWIIMLATGIGMAFDATGLWIHTRTL